MKTVIISMALGGLLAACGGAPEELEGDTTEELFLETTEQAVCEGWEDGGRYCTWKCYSGSPYRYAAYGSVAYGDCRAHANYMCGREAYLACWSKL